TLRSAVSMKTPARQLSLVLPLCLCVGVLSSPTPARAGEPESTDADEASDDGGAAAEASVSLAGGEAAAEADQPAADPSTLPWKLRVGIVAQTRNRGRTDFPWIKRWAPERLMVEVGLFG